MDTKTPEQIRITLLLSDENSVSVKLSLFKDYPNCFIFKILDDFENITEIPLTDISIEEFAELKPVLEGKKLEQTLPIELWEKANRYMFTKDVVYVGRKYYEQFVENEIKELDAFPVKRQAE